MPCKEQGARRPIAHGTLFLSQRPARFGRYADHHPVAVDDTKKFLPDDCVMLVAVPDALVLHVAEICKMVVVRSRFPTQACERMLSTRPHVVVVGGSPSDAEFERLDDVCAAVNAQLILLRDIGDDRASLDRHLRSAVMAATVLRSAKT
jgi:hypothetical protein